MLNTIFYKDDDAVILHEDMLGDTKIRDNHIDLIVTSPPYNVGKEYINNDDNLEYEDYLNFTEKNAPPAMARAV